MESLRKMGLGFNMVIIVMVMMISMHEGGVMGFKEVKVGGVQTWRVPDGNNTDFYNQWAASKRFRVGDSLLFQYQNDSVLVVDKYGYFHCDVTKASSTFNDGNTTVKLEHPGLIYFISGSVDHCRAGQRLEVDVMSPHPHPIAAPPSAESHDHGQAAAPAPAEAYSKHSGSSIAAQASSLLGLVVAASMLLF